MTIFFGGYTPISDILRLIFNHLESFRVLQSLVQQLQWKRVAVAAPSSGNARTRSTALRSGIWPSRGWRYGALVVIKPTSGGWRIHQL